MSNSEATLKPQQWQAIALLASGRSQGEVCQELSVSRATLQRWLQISEFKDAIAEVVTDNFNESVAKSVNLSTKALEQLEAIMSDPKEKAYSRVAAALGVLNHSATALKLASTIAVEKRAKAEADETQVIFNFGAPIKNDSDE